MRTTLTLDPDVAAQLQELARERGVPFKEIVNSTLRRGLQPSAERPQYRLPTFPMGVREGVNLDKALGLASDMEDAEILRKLELRK